MGLLEPEPSAYEPELTLSPQEQSLLSGAEGDGVAMAMRIVVGAARLLGAESLTPIASAHIDGCLYHGDSGALFAERLAALGARVRVPTTLNVGALDLLHRGRTRLAPEAASMAQRMAAAYVAMGCRQTWTCAPYQAGHRPAQGADVAWGESNAVAFCNSVLGARTNRYGDFLDICCAIVGRAPRTGLHLKENRRATVLVDAADLPAQFFAEEIAYPILGAWLGAEIGDEIAAFDGLPSPTEDNLKALGAAAASTGAVGLFHVIGTTPEARTREDAFGDRPPARVIRLKAEDLRAARSGLSTVRFEPGQAIDAVAIGSPHLSVDELLDLDRRLGERQCRATLYACTGRHVLADPRTAGIEPRLAERGVVVVADTCIVVTPILPAASGVLVTNSGKFAHYTPANTGFEVIFANLGDCIESAVEGRLAMAAVP